MKTDSWICPKCGKGMPQVEDYEFDGDSMGLELWCSDCGTSWKEFFGLTYDGYRYDGKIYNADGKLDSAYETIKEAQQ